MTYNEAQTEFNIRLYRWAKSALEKEISEGFPRFQLNKDWSKLRCHFIQTLDRQSQATFCQGILQKHHQDAATALGEAISAEAEALMRSEETFRSNNAWVRSADAQVSFGKQTMATRRELKKAIAVHFRAAFGDECLPLDPLDGKSDLRFRMKCRGWIIKTGFEFGRWDPEITCDHNIWTGKWITKEEPQVLFANCIGFRLSYGNEIGIGSGWENIATVDIEPACLSVIEHCRLMFDVFPILLEDLDLGLLTT